MTTSDNSITVRKKPMVAATLQVIFFVGGAGYLYLGQRRKALMAFVWSAALLGIDAVAASNGLNKSGTVAEWTALAKVIAPIWFGFILITALDAKMLAERLNKQGSIQPSDVALPMLKLILCSRVNQNAITPEKHVTTDLS
jgi:hypothetical protein